MLREYLEAERRASRGLGGAAAGRCQKIGRSLGASAALTCGTVMSASAFEIAKPMKDWICVLPLLRPYWKQLCLALVAMLLDALLTVLQPWPLKVVIDRVFSHRPTRVPFIRTWLDSASLTRVEILYTACLAVLLIAVITGLLTYYFTNLMGGVGQRFVYELRRNLFAHLQRLSLRFHDRQRTGDLTARLTSEVQAVQ